MKQTIEWSAVRSPGRFIGIILRPALRVRFAGLAVVAAFIIGTASLKAQDVHRFKSISALSAATISLEVAGDTPSAFLNYFDLFPLETSTDLSNWSSLTTIVRTNRATNAMVYLDTEAPSNRRFYRTPTNDFITALTRPSGPHPVGRTTRVLTDPSRTNRYRIPTNSSFMITIWYPAVSTAGVWPGAYIDSQLAAPLAELHLDSPGDVASRLARFVSYSLPNEAVAPAASPYPVVIYSHGYTFHRQESSEKMEELASHGFVAVAMDHVDCRATVYPDERVVRGVFADPPNPSDISTAVANRLADNVFVLKALEELNASDPLLMGRLDLNRLGAMGWSLGNSDLGILTDTDRRFKALFMLEGYLQGASALLEKALRQGYSLPVLAIYQDDRTLVPLFQQVASNSTQDAYFSLTHITSHFAFKDLTEASLAAESFRRGAAAMRACMLSFFNKYLNGKDDHLLDNPTNAFPVLHNYVKH